jgi:hypothetical protein
MTENDHEWQKNTPQSRTKRRAEWGSGWRSEDADTEAPGRKPEGSYAKGKRWK